MGEPFSSGFANATYRSLNAFRFVAGNGNVYRGPVQWHLMLTLGPAGDPTNDRRREIATDALNYKSSPQGSEDNSALGRKSPSSRTPWRMVQSAANQSLGPNSLIYRENTGKYTHFRYNLETKSQKPQQSPRLFSEIPRACIRELFLTSREIPRDMRE
jgi:hypothetical protein